ncbi:hypothetical protein BBP40_002886 [Aspergillus hancockii]|nr:hypothetical protein BBP40_002886 [Aspergillus hancockii]
MLCLAVSRHVFEVINLLLERGADASLPSRDDNTPIDMLNRMPWGSGDRVPRNLQSLSTGFPSAVQAAPELVDHLIEHAPELMNVTDQYGFTALHFALSQKDFKYAWLLLDRGIFIRHNNGHNHTELWWAVRTGEEDMVREILSRQFSKHYLKSRGGRWLGDISALTEAVWRKRWDILQLLIDDLRVRPDESFAEAMWKRWSGVYFRIDLEQTFHDRSQKGGRRSGFFMMHC